MNNNTPIWKVQEYIEDVPFRVYRWKNHSIILQHPNTKINLNEFRIALSKNGNKPKVVSVHTTYSDALIYVRIYQHEIELEHTKKTYLQIILDKIKNFLNLHNF